MKYVRSSMILLLLLAAVALAALWVRSFWVGDQWVIERFESRADERWTIVSAHGRIGLELIRYTSAQLPRPTTGQAGYSRLSPDDLFTDDRWLWHILIYRQTRTVTTPFSTLMVRVVAVPFWMPMLLLLLGPSLAWYRTRRRKQARIDQGLCPNCGYDCRATPLQCPECGYVPRKQAHVV